MNYSMVLLATVTSQVQQLHQEVHDSLEPQLQQIAELVTSFFGSGTLADLSAGL
jgi:hypothetical protein